MTQKSINQISYQIIGAAMEVHRQLGPGLLESVYEECFIEEMKLRNLTVDSQLKVPLFYRGKSLKTELRLDILVENTIIVELKAVEQMIPLYKANYFLIYDYAKNQKDY